MENYNSDPVILPVENKDLNKLAEFIKFENNDPEMNAGYLNWWYFQNPFESFSLNKLVIDNTIEGVASTNNYKLTLNNKSIYAAFPQKVLNSKKVRGKGYFNKLYQSTEKANLGNGINHFLTFTNEMSTPIFLKKFGYLRGEMPDLYFIPNNPLGLLTSKRYEITDKFNPEDFKSIYQYPNSIFKDSGYVKWRYFKYTQDENLVLRIKNKAGNYSGTVFLKKIYKKKIPLFLVLDIIVPDQAELKNVLNQTTAFLSRNLAVGMLLFDNSMFGSDFLPKLHYKIKNRFNFLVKGQTDNDTKMLAGTNFNFFFGDLDFT